MKALSVVGYLAMIGGILGLIALKSLFFHFTGGYWGAARRCGFGDLGARDFRTQKLSSRRESHRGGPGNHRSLPLYPAPDLHGGLSLRDSWRTRPSIPGSCIALCIDLGQLLRSNALRGVPVGCALS